MDVLILEFVLAHDSSPKGTSTYLMFEIKINQVGKGSLGPNSQIRSGLKPLNEVHVTSRIH